jgi:hypothetical protein
MENAALGSAESTYCPPALHVSPHAPIALHPASSRYCQINIILPMFLIVLLGFTLFAIDEADVGSRLEVLMSLVITGVAFKISAKGIIDEHPQDLPYALTPPPPCHAQFSVHVGGRYANGVTACANPRPA